MERRSPHPNARPTPRLETRSPLALILGGHFVFASTLRLTLKVEPSEWLFERLLEQAALAAPKSD